MKMTSLLRAGSLGSLGFCAYYCIVSLLLVGKLSNAISIRGYSFVNDVSSIQALENAWTQIDNLLDVDYISPAEYYQNGMSLINANFGNLLVDASGSPLYALNLEYWNDNVNYAMDIVTMAYSGSGWFDSIQSNALAREAGMFEALRVFVIRSAMLHEMDQAVQYCLSSPSTARLHWDRAAGFYFGKANDYGDGRLLFELSNSLCSKSGTCANDGDSLNNQEVITKLIQGTGFLNSANCSELSKAALDIGRLLQVPSFQFLMKHSYKLESAVSPSSNDLQLRARAHVHVLSLLPYLSDCDPSKASLLLSNFRVNASPYIKDGYNQISQVLKSFLPCLGLRCDQVGHYADYIYVDVTACTDAPGRTPRPTRTPTIFPSQAPTTASMNTKTPTLPNEDIETSQPTRSPTLRSNGDDGLKASVDNSQTSMVVGLSSSVAAIGLFIGGIFIALRIRQKRRAEKIPVIVKDIIVPKEDPLEAMRH